MSADKLHGRATPPLPEFTFPDSGITVKIRKMAPETAALVHKSLRKQRAAPEPPLNAVDYGDGKTRMERNLADPFYSKELDAYQTWFNEESGKRLIKLILQEGVIVEFDAEEVSDFRARMADQDLADELEGSDRDVYLKHFCLKSGNDMQALMGAVMAHSQPTEEAVQTHVETFRGDVS